MPDPLSPFIASWLPTLSARLTRPARALDVAMGSGRHAVELAAAGFITLGVDLAFDRVRAARLAARSRDLDVHGWVADLTASPMPSRHFDLVLCTRYLQRDLFSALIEAIRPGGFLLYETFTRLQLTHRRGPTSPDHLLEPGELLRLCAGMSVEKYEEVENPEAVGRLVARRL